MRSRLVMIAGSAAVAAACAKQETKTDTPRPVRSAVVAEASGDAWVLSGEVRARYETRLAFRLPGQMVERKVEVGERVRAGQAVAVLAARDARRAAPPPLRVLGTRPARASRVAGGARRGGPQALRRAAREKLHQPGRVRPARVAGAPGSRAGRRGPRPGLAS